MVLVVMIYYVTIELPVVVVFLVKVNYAVEIFVMMILLVVVVIN
jgi:hypothetical protein